jgi:hypothetical protein
MDIQNESISEAEVSLTIIRADGTREDLGVVGYYNKSRLRKLLYMIRGWKS